MTWSHVFFHWVFLSSLPGSGQLGALFCGYKTEGRRHVPSWGCSGRGRAAETRGASFGERGRGERTKGAQSMAALHIPAASLALPWTPTPQPLALPSLEELPEVMGRTRCEGKPRKPSGVHTFQEGLRCSPPPACVTPIGSESLSDPGHHKLEVSPFWTLRGWERVRAD